MNERHSSLSFSLLIGDKIFSSGSSILHRQLSDISGVVKFGAINEHSNQRLELFSYFFLWMMKSNWKKCTAQCTVVFAVVVVVVANNIIITCNITAYFEYVTLKLFCLPFEPLIPLSGYVFNIFSVSSKVIFCFQWRDHYYYNYYIDFCCAYKFFRQ